MTISGIDWASKIPHGGVHTVSTDEDTANTVSINTGKPDAVGCIVQVLRSGVVTTGANVAMVSGVITVKDVSAGYTLTADDVLTWIVF